MDASFLPFLADRDVALFGGDTAHEVRDNIPGLDLTVGHKFAIVARGAVGPMGVSLHGESRSGAGGHRLTDQPDCGVLTCCSKESAYFRADVPDSIDVQFHLKDRTQKLVESSQLVAPRS